MTDRVDWDRYFMNIARVASSRATCHRKFVGAVIVRDRTILSTGYNGSIRGMPHCSDAGHLMEDGHCIATIHAEMNAIIQSARNGTSIEGASIYITASPCWSCFKALANAGIQRICYGEFYRNDRSFEVASTLGIEMVHVALEEGDTVQVPPAEGPRSDAAAR
jgi:dCMP deaminase